MDSFHSSPMARMVALHAYVLVNGRLRRRAHGLCSAADAAEYRPPRLEDGHPDLQGVWDHIDATPLERPAGFTTLVITAEQAAAIKRLSVEIAEDRSTPTEPTEYFNERHMLPIRGEFHSSTLIDPPDGRIPGTAQFKQWQVKTRAAVVNAVDMAPNSVRRQSVVSATRRRSRRISTTLGRIFTRSCRRRTLWSSSRK